jgi:2-haloalkanoic acid dehalogenase type II
MMGGLGSRINRTMADAPYQALTFDCYGTLVDWRAGMSEGLAAQPLLRGRETRFDDLLAARDAAERELEGDAYLPYREVLALSLQGACRSVLGLDLPEVEAHRFADAQARWPAFPDSVAALRRLGARFRLAVLSNSDRAPLECTADTVLAGTVTPLVSAEDVRSYKPAPAHFEEALRRLEAPPEQVLHVSAYPYFDLEPAHALGLPVAFVRRDPAVPRPTGLPLVAATQDLAALADALLG